MEVRDILLEFCARQAWMVGPFKEADMTLENILNVMKGRYTKLGIALEVGLAEIPMVAKT